MPFAINAATKYISPTKTPEYLAAGKPVVSTPIADVVRTYGAVGLAHIAETPDAFVQAIHAALCEPATRRQALADAHLASQAWDQIWARISERLRAAIIERRLKADPAAAHARLA
jgi:UDP-galactopyranose mutase